jgi:hypothetical protein
MDYSAHSDDFVISQYLYWRGVRNYQHYYHQAQAELVKRGILVQRGAPSYGYSWSKSK